MWGFFVLYLRCMLKMLKLFNRSTYSEKLYTHYKNHFGVSGEKIIPDFGSVEKLHPEFHVLRFKTDPNQNIFCYCTIGMSLDRNDSNLIELFVYSPGSHIAIVELLTVCASYHRNTLPLNIHHTVNIGRPWLPGSLCDHAFISLPYIEGDKLEKFSFNNITTHCYWLIPITEKERDFKIANGCEELEQIFEANSINYLNPLRESLV